MTVRDGALVQGRLGDDDVVVRFYDEWNGRTLHESWNYVNVYGMDGQSLFHRAVAGNADALAAFETIGRSLGSTILWLYRELSLDVFVMGGGVTNGYHFFQTALNDVLRDMGVVAFKTSLEHAGLLGAAVLFETEHGQSYFPPPYRTSGPPGA